MTGLEFEYDAPFGFNKNKVKGRLGSLVKLDEENHDKATALEMAAGGKLWNVVVDDEAVGSALLKLKLQKRVTLIPLNKISNNRLDARKVAAAQRLAPGKVHLALDLVSYPPEIANAMIYAFGNTFICENEEVAKKVTFAPEVRARSVTLKGDIYDPSGTLTGGAAPTSSGVLVKVQAWIEADGALRSKQAVLAQFEQQEKAAAKVRGDWKTMQKNLDMKLYQIQLLEQQNEGSNAMRVRVVVFDSLFAPLILFNL